MAPFRTRAGAAADWWRNLENHTDMDGEQLLDFLPFDGFNDRMLHPSTRVTDEERSFQLLLRSFTTSHGQTSAIQMRVGNRLEVAFEPAVGCSDPSVSVRISRRYEVAKRVLDTLASAVGLIMLSPVFAAIGLLIKREDDGPVFHLREVVGLGGRLIRAYKFRTMMVNADEYLRCRPDLLREYAENMKLRRDPRITRIGSVLRRTSLDELPQLLNVLRGEMSLVGPRMIHPSEQSRYGEFALVRQCVRPGITGLWQVSGRQEVSYAARVEFDRAYLRQRSFWFDLKILARTVGVLLRRYGAY